jgi:hypothetical protein
VIALSAAVENIQWEEAVGTGHEQLAARFGDADHFVCKFLPFIQIAIGHIVGVAIYSDVWKYAAAVDHIEGIVLEGHVQSVGQEESVRILADIPEAGAVPVIDSDRRESLLGQNVDVASRPATHGHDLDGFLSLGEVFAKGRKPVVVGGVPDTLILISQFVFLDLIRKAVADNQVGNVVLESERRVTAGAVDLLAFNEEVIFLTTGAQKFDRELQKILKALIARNLFFE